MAVPVVFRSLATSGIQGTKDPAANANKKFPLGEVGLIAWLQ